MVAIAHVVTALHVVSGTLLIVDRLEGGGVAATTDLRSSASSRSGPGRLVHLHVEDCSEELLRQQSYAIKNQLGHPKRL